MLSRLSVNYLNAGKGESIVIKLEGEKTDYIVIDSNKIKINTTYINPALEYLKREGTKKISALILTHFHTDHYWGIEDLFNNFEIAKFCFPPVLSRKSSQFDKVLEKFKSKLIQTLANTNAPEITGKMRSLFSILNFMKDSNNQDVLEEIEGPDSNFHIPGISEPIGRVLLPFPNIKGSLFMKIQSEDFEFDSYSTINEMSSALMLELFNKRILLTSDSEISQWREHKRRSLRYNIKNLKANFLKSPHHGSQNNNSQELFNYFFDQTTDDKYIFVSADGKEHPHNIIFELIDEYALKPYCTNLAHQCMGEILEGLFVNPSELHQGLLGFLLNYPIYQYPSLCQGDICLTITPANFDITNSTGYNCIYRF